MYTSAAGSSSLELPLSGHRQFTPTRSPRRQVSGTAAAHRHARQLIQKTDIIDLGGVERPGRLPLRRRKRSRISNPASSARHPVRCDRHVKPEVSAPHRRERMVNDITALAARRLSNGATSDCAVCLCTCSEPRTTQRPSYSDVVREEGFSRLALPQRSAPGLAAPACLYPGCGFGKRVAAQSRVAAPPADSPYWYPVLAVWSAEIHLWDHRPSSEDRLPAILAAR